MDKPKSMDFFPRSAGTVIKILQMIDNSSTSFRDIIPLISSDPGLTSLVMSAANSSLYCTTTPTSDVAIALGRIGIENLRLLAVQRSLTHLFKRDDPRASLLQDLWKHSAFTGQIALELGKEMGLGAELSDLQMAGLFHDIGIFYHIAFCPDEFKKLFEYISRFRVDICVAERILKIQSHAVLGAKVLSENNLPDLVVKLVRYHETDRDSQREDLSVVEKVLTMILRTSDLLAFRFGPKPDVFKRQVKIDKNILVQLAVSPEEVRAIVERAGEFLKKIQS